MITAGLYLTLIGFYWELAIFQGSRSELLHLAESQHSLEIESGWKCTISEVSQTQLTGVDDLVFSRGVTCLKSDGFGSKNDVTKFEAVVVCPPLLEPSKSGSDTRIRLFGPQAMALLRLSCISD